MQHLGPFFKAAEFIQQLVILPAHQNLAEGSGKKSINELQGSGALLGAAELIELFVVIACTPHDAAEETKERNIQSL